MDMHVISFRYNRQIFNMPEKIFSFERFESVDIFVSVQTGTWPMCCRQFICSGNFINGYNFLCVTMINLEIHSAGIVRCYVRIYRLCEMLLSVSIGTVRCYCQYL